MSKKKSYSKFTAEDIRQLGLTIRQRHLFSDITPIKPSALLLETLQLNQTMPLSSEKARSELLISPILLELRRQNPQHFTYFSGYQFDVDKARGLHGFCDFIISPKYDAVFLEAPLITMVEAKENQDLFDAAPQCMAEMYAARLYNERHNENITIIHGVVTSGYEWLFLKLEENTVWVDITRYNLNNLNELLGVWQKIIDFYN